VANRTLFSSQQELFPATERYNAKYLKWDTFGVGNEKIAATGFVVAHSVTSVRRPRRGSRSARDALFHFFELAFAFIDISNGTLDASVGKQLLATYKACKNGGGPSRERGTVGRPQDNGVGRQPRGLPRRTMGAVIGAAGDFLVPKGKAKGLLMTALVAGARLGVLICLFGLAAVVSGQPYAVHYPGLLLGSLLSGLAIPFVFVMRNRYRQVELRKMQADELS
jgi:hypothetical protein